MVGLSVECAQGDLPEVWRLEGGNAGEEEREKPKQQGAQRRTSLSFGAEYSTSQRQPQGKVDAPASMCYKCHCLPNVLP